MEKVLTEFEALYPHLIDGTAENHEIPLVRRVDVPIEIWTNELPHTRQKCFHLRYLARLSASLACVGIPSTSGTNERMPVCVQSLFPCVFLNSFEYTCSELEDYYKWLIGKHAKLSSCRPTQTFSCQSPAGIEEFIKKLGQDIGQRPFSRMLNLPHQMEERFCSFILLLETSDWQRLAS
jgi:hypothetical protein